MNRITSLTRHLFEALQAHFTLPKISLHFSIAGNSLTKVKEDSPVVLLICYIEVSPMVSQYSIKPHQHVSAHKS